MEMTNIEKEHRAMKSLLVKRQIKIDELTKEVIYLRDIIQSKDIQIADLRRNVKLINSDKIQIQNESTRASNKLQHDEEIGK